MTVAVEVRNQKWFKDEWVSWASKLEITWVCLDSPDFPTEVYNETGWFYQRIHSRTLRYARIHSDKEPEEVLKKIMKAK